MRFEERVPDALFKEDGHYLGRPADFNDRIIHRRLRLVSEVSDFCGVQYELLEIGCGNGATLFGLSDKMKTCLGLEINADHLDEFEKYKFEKGIDNCNYKIVNIENTEPEKEFDRMISFEVIEHLENEDSVSYFYKALKPGGKLIVSVPNKWWIFETHGARLPLLPWNRVPFFSWLPTPIHEKFANARIYTKSRIKKVLEKQGFIVKDMKYIMAPMDVLPNGKFKNFVIKLLFNQDTTYYPFKSTSIFVVAEKAK